ncbi:MAG TPA: Lrp/AsnC ligand binding domain-containing protein [archaeon]|nr:Lrp/AsnC ligand binding domain-containing protein [archaeon]
MALAFALIKAGTSKELFVYRQLKKIKEVEYVHPLFGEFDLIAKFSGEDYNRIGEIYQNMLEAEGVVKEKCKILNAIKF